MNEDLIQALLQEASPSILAGLSLEDTTSVAVEFERLLRVILEKDRSYLPNPDAMSSKIAKSITKEVSETTPETRLEYIQTRLLDQEIGNLDMSSWNIAEQSLHESPDLPALQTKARVILDKIIQIQLLLKQKGPSWEKRYDRTLSEASLDCRYVLGESQYSSLRLGRILAFLNEQNGKRSARN